MPLSRFPVPERPLFSSQPQFVAATLLSPVPFTLASNSSQTVPIPAPHPCILVYPTPSLSSSPLPSLSLFLSPSSADLTTHFRSYNCNTSLIPAHCTHTPLFLPFSFSFTHTNTQPPTYITNMGSLRKSQYYFFGFLTVYMMTGIGALVLGNIWLNQSVSGAPREAVISRAIEKGKKKRPFSPSLPAPIHSSGCIHLKPFSTKHTQHKTANPNKQACQQEEDRKKVKAGVI